MPRPPDKRSTVAFTGHRPDKYSFGYDEDNDACNLVKASIKACLQQALMEGYTDFLTGMALGADIWAAEQVLFQRKAAPHIGLHAIRPFAGQSSRWSPDWRARYDAVLAQCDTVRTLQDEYTRGCMMARNRQLVDGADRLIAVFNGSAGGTSMTLDYARRRGLHIILIHPETGEIDGLALGRMGAIAHGG